MRAKPCALPPSVIVKLTRDQKRVLAPLFVAVWDHWRAGKPPILLGQPIEKLTIGGTVHEMKVGMFTHSEGRKAQATLKGIVKARRKRSASPEGGER